MVPQTLLGVDFGTSNTVAVLHRDGHGTPLLFEGSPLLPSAVFLDPVQGLLVGRDAERAAGAAPAHLEPNPKRRVDEHTVWLGEQETAVTDLIAAVLRRVGGEARRVLGQPPDRVVLTHPAGWGNQRLGVLTEAAARAGLGTPHLMTEPAAAAWYFITTLDRTVAPGRCVVVYDLGAGTFDVAVLRRSPEGFDVLAADGLNDLGGLDLDAAVVGHLRAQTPADAWGVLDWPRTPADRRARRLLWDDVRAAKEQLSRHPVATLHVPLVDADLHVTREEFERLARPMLARTVATTVAALRAARIGRDAVAGVFLVGGSSRVPLAAVLLHQELGIAPTVIEQPELVVASGAGSPVREPAVARAPAWGPATREPETPGPLERTRPAPMEPAPVESARPAPIEPAPLGPARPAPMEPAPARPLGRRRSKLLVAGGLLALAGTALNDLRTVAERLWSVSGGDRSLGWSFGRDARADVYVEDLLGSMIVFAAVAVAAALCFRSDERRWTGAGLLAGLGMFAVGPAAYHLSDLSRTTSYQLGYGLAVTGGLLAVAAVWWGRPGTGLRRPVRPAWSTALVALAVVAALLYLMLRFLDDVPIDALLFWAVCTAGVTVALPVWAVVARPAAIGAGAVAAVGATIVPTVLDLSFIYRVWGPLQMAAWAVHSLLGLAMVAVAVVALRAPADGTSTAGAQAGTGNGMR